MFSLKTDCHFLYILCNLNVGWGTDVHVNEYIFISFKRTCAIFLFILPIFSLAVFDCLLIIDSFVQKSLIPYFTNVSPSEPEWFKVTYPYFWYPFRGIIVTITIYMMVAISAERFRAVCYPLSKRHVSKCVLKSFFHYK